MLLAKEQRLGAAVLIGIALVGWLVVALWPSRQTITAPEPAEPTKHRSWEERKDSMRHADSVRYAEWAKEREQRYDSFRVADSLRRAELKAEWKVRRDSARVADSLWRDSMGIYFTKRFKKDTIIDLNHCDTTDLLYLRGIGPYTAIQIIRYREQLGGYASPTQLTDAPFANCHLDSLLTSFTADSAAIDFNQSMSTHAPSTACNAIPTCVTTKPKPSIHSAAKRYACNPSTISAPYPN